MKYIITMTDKNWKNHLLKSGLPFEYEVKECLVRHNCTVWDEYSYVRYDENNIEKEFSYDIDANYWDISSGNSFSFLVECKYKTEPTKWFFLPDPYFYQSDITQNSFLHPIDYFTERNSIFKDYLYEKILEPLGPFCLKGIEVYQNQFLEVNIFKAINQLSFAFIDKVIGCIQSQIETSSFFNTIFFNIPIVITNAELYLINEKLTTADVEAAKDISEVSTKHDFLIFNNKIGEKLWRHNLAELNNYFTTIDESLFKEKNKSFTNDKSHFVDVLSQHYCPEAILIMHHDAEHRNYQKLFDYINFMIKPSDELKQKMEIAKNEWKRKSQEFKSKFPPME